MSYQHNTRKKAIKHFQEAQSNGQGYIVVNGKKSIYEKINGQWKLLDFKG